MPSEVQQNLANHTRRDNGLIALVIVAVVAIFLAAAGVAGDPSPLSVAVVLLGICIVFALIKMRRYSLMVQDRVIRLEMRLRLAAVLPPDLAERAKALTLRQMIAVRFASDAELPALVQKVLDENIQASKDIKRHIKSWQPDHMRV